MAETIPNTEGQADTPKEKTPVEAAQELHDNLKTENDRAEKIRAEEALAGTSGGRVAEVPKKVESNHEYRLRIEAEMLAGKHND